MQFKNFEIHATPHVMRAYCPKDKSKLVELSKSWFEPCWYCHKCEVPYELKMVKMRKWDKEQLAHALNSVEVKRRYENTKT